MTKSKKIILSIMLVLLVIIVAIWLYAFDNGKIEIRTGLDSYSVFVDETETVCQQDPCIITVTDDIHEIRFEKDGYNSITSTVYVKRGETSPIDLEPKKITKLTPSEIIIDEDGPKIPVPSGFNEQYSAITYSWNNSRERFLFLDSEDSRLKILEKDGEITLITVLKNIEAPVNIFWSEDEERILINKDSDFYFIDVDSGSRKKQIIDFEPDFVTWSPDNSFILLNDKELNLFSIDWNKQDYLKPLNKTLDLSLSIWINDEELLIHKSDDEINKTVVSLYNPLTNTTQELTQKFDFPVDDIYYDPDINTVFLHDSMEEQWYEMEL